MPEQNAETLTQQAIMAQATAEDQIIEAERSPGRRRRAQAQAPGETLMGVLVETVETDDLTRLVLPDEIRADIMVGLRMVTHRQQMEAVWSLSQIEHNASRVALNFYGPPGTGKTRVARAIARRLGRPLLQVEYSSVISKFLGDTAKNIVAAFRQAKELGAVLFFDEADSMLSKRVNLDQSCATSINQNRNVLMQELDRFPGLVIFTTNLFSNYDEALLRRIAKHVRFKLPNRAQRRALLELHLPNLDRVEADLGRVALESKGLSGGDIKNVCLNAMWAASTSEDSGTWTVTEEILSVEISRVLEAKRDHAPAGGLTTPGLN